MEEGFANASRESEQHLPEHPDQFPIAIESAAACGMLKD